MNFCTKRILTELKELANDSSHYLYVDNNLIANIDDIEENDYRTIYCNIYGPKYTPYENAIFKLCIKLSNDYPYNPPTFKFLTPIYHPNLYSEDYFTIYDNYNDWCTTQTIRSMILSIYVLMSQPNKNIGCNICKNCNNSKLLDIIDVFNNDIKLFNFIANQWTKMYAFYPKIWSIVKHKYLLSNINNYEYSNEYILYLLWLGKYFYNINYTFSDIWIVNIMPLIIDIINPKLYNKNINNINKLLKLKNIN